MGKLSMEETIERAQGKIPYDYYPNFDEMATLYREGKHEDIYEALIAAFEYGFIKGTRAHQRKRVPAL